ncbi:MAG TPA: serine hydrolase domain-containing protein [Gemmatimonadales bacterium]|nr:serine hydrolase domain-containing protein [Gemmatimonadales bacterium]
MSRAAGLTVLALLAAATPLEPQAQGGDDLDRFIRAEMARRQLPGLSIAIIQDGRIEARAYGVIEKGGTTSVTPATLFQAGSISKPVAAAGALRLVEQGRLSLDAPVNDYLTAWKVPGNRFTEAKPVTLAGILSHTAGLTVHGFPGYVVGGPAATLVQILDGVPPANTAPIRVDTTPGSIWRYSGGGYTVMQQMVVDVTQRPFPDFMRETVLVPFGMTSSTFAQPLPPELAARTASGHYQDRRLVEGRWHVYPEMAAAGLWTTPSDLARFAIGLQRTLAGESRAALSQAMARQMVTERMNGMGLGLALSTRGGAAFFGHNGRDEGFDALLTASVGTGQGLDLMINANDNSGLRPRIVDFVAKKYHWPGAASTPAPAILDRSVSPAAVRALAGRYEFRNNLLMTLIPADTGLWMLTDGLPDLEFLPVGADRFAGAGSNLDFTVVRDSGGVVTGIRWASSRGGGRLVPRVGPLIETLPRNGDSSPALTATVNSALDALRRGQEAVGASTAITPGAKRDFAGVPAGFFEEMRDLRFLGTESVAGRQIERHDALVARVAYFSLMTRAGRRYLLAYLTAEGLLTDVDLVDR